MSQAMDNERLAVRQKLAEAYSTQLIRLRSDLEQHLRSAGLVADGIDTSMSPAAAFATLVRTPGISSAVVYDAAGHVTYPDSPRPMRIEATSSAEAWDTARQLEFVDRDTETAAKHYADIARQATDLHYEARALQSQARCLIKSGNKAAAMTLIMDELTQQRFAGAVDEQARLIAPNAQLLALQLIDDPTSSEWTSISAALRHKLEAYGNPAMSGVQRRFLMQQLQDIAGNDVPFETLAPEVLAGRFVDSRALIPKNDPALRLAQLPDVWAMGSGAGRFVLLFEETPLIAALQEIARHHMEGAAVNISVLPPDEGATEASAFVSVPGGTLLPGWRLTLHLSEEDLFDEQADQRIAGYVWIGTLVIVVMAGLAILIARVFRKQMHITRLKNDLLATVSHELKTPLASMRLLVDTLLEAQTIDPVRSREYLQLIAKENIRLSRLIDNFLTFSRMERNKEAFDRDRVDVARIVTQATESVQERFASAGCQFEVNVGSGLPNVDADCDALVTVLINLLDNAFKYTDDDKHIALQAFADNGYVCFEVRDNGIGLSKRSASKAFDRFYRVDHELSRRAEGCGLGLSIVRFIVDAHDGTVFVDSAPGKGSTFTVRLPAIADDAPAPQDG
jgi:signal transduction histidine kinase